ncbi:MAG: DUF1801 domain-containing protein [Methylococcaceae bacterium]|nr:DUF1801 domain-containing protein [Methylococcaceae bacterium]
MIAEDPVKVEVIELIREIFHNANQKLSEEIKYGGVVFNLSNSLVGGIFPYKQHISIEFCNGVGFPDPSGMRFTFTLYCVDTIKQVRM